MIFSSFKNYSFKIIDWFCLFCIQQNITRLGRWIDFKNDYKTMYPSFMESIWWVFKQLYDKGLVYRGFKVCFCRCSICVLVAAVS